MTIVPVSTGQLANVRKTSSGQLPVQFQFTPAKIPTGMVYFDASRPGTLYTDTARTTLVSAATDVVKGITDLSGEDNHGSNTGNGPEYQPNIYNGLSVLHFDSASSQYLDIAPGAMATSWYVAWVGALLDLAPTNDAIIGHSPYIRHVDIDTVDARGDDLVGKTINHTSDPVDTNLHIYEYICESDGTFRFHIDGTEVGTNTGLDVDFTPTRIGRRGSDYANIHLGEIVIASTLPTSFFTDNLLSYWATKWGI